jgi:hypothetical protein
MGQRYNGERLHKGGLCAEPVCARRGERGEESLNGKVKGGIEFLAKGSAE